jgi:Zn-dependent peptidase ImmA (M78 family)
LNKYEELLNDANKSNIVVTDQFDLSGTRIKGLYCDGTIALNRDMYIESEKTCVLAEELGHHYTTVGDIMDQTDVSNRKQERRARIWAYHKLLSLNDLIDSYKCGCRNQFEIAEHLNVTEEFLVDCLKYYKEKYGLYVRKDNYLIYFEPLGIMDFCRNSK